MRLRELFATDANRAENYTFDAAGLHVDLSKTSSMKTSSSTWSR